MFEIDFKRLCMQLLPTFLRQPVLFGLLRAALNPLESLYSSFKDMRSGHVYRLAHNGQVCYLQAVLNDAFKSKYGKFEIVSLEKEGDWLYAYTEGGTKMEFAADEARLEARRVGDRYVMVPSGGEGVPLVYNEAMLNAVENAFIVLVPADFYNDYQLRNVSALVDRYKLISKYAIYMAKSA